MAGTGRKTWAADEILAAADLQSYIQDQVVFVYANATARASGILSPTEGMVSYLQDTDLLYTYSGSSWVAVTPSSISASIITSGTLDAARLPNAGTAGTYTKVTTDATGRVTYATTLAAADIPNLDASKITSGSLNTGGNVTGGNLYVPNGEITGGSGGHVYHQGYGIFDSGVTSSGVYNTSLSGPYRAVWVNSSGTIGYTSSTRRVKQDIEPAQISSDAALLLNLVQYRRIQNVKEMGADAPVETGLIAEDLIAAGNGLEQFVFFDDDGKPAGIHYELLALALIPTIQMQAEQIASIEARLAKLEKK